MKDLFSVEGKTVLVTGGSRGIGLMIARGFVENGARVYVSSRKAEVCDAVAKELSKHGTCTSLPADLSKMEEIQRVAAELASKESALHVLVNNAGANWGEDIETFPESGWDKVMDLNLKSVFFLTRDLLTLLKKGGTAEDPARVINISSIDGLHVPALETYSYSSSKAALVHLTKVLARKLAPDDVTVNCVCPGPFESKMMAATLEQFGDTIVKTNPRKRIGVPEDMAGVSIFLASKAGSYITGAVIPVDGGISSTL